MKPRTGILLATVLATSPAAVCLTVHAGQTARAAVASHTTVEWVEIPGGVFNMGCTPGDAECSVTESPVRRITLKPFAMAATEATNAQYDACVKVKECAAGKSEGGPDFPVINVTWSEAVSFCAWAGGWLPSESEWEYAARSGRNDWRYPWGDTTTHDNANYGADKCCAGLAQGKDQWERTSPVGSFPPNRFGLFDLIGNVFEWVQDVDGALSTTPQDGAPRTVRTPEIHTLRGGSFLSSAGSRVSYRPGLRGTSREWNTGIRCARSSSPSAVASASSRLGPPAVPVGEFMSVNRRRREQTQLIDDVAKLYLTSLSLAMDPGGRLRTEAQRRETRAYASLIRALFTVDPGANAPEQEPVGFREVRVRVPAASEASTLGDVLSAYLVGTARTYKLETTLDMTDEARLKRFRTDVEVDLVEAEIAASGARLEEARKDYAEAARRAEEAKRWTDPAVHAQIDREQQAIWKDLGPLVATLLQEAPTHFTRIKGESVRQHGTDVREFRSRLLTPTTQAAGQPLAAWLFENLVTAGADPGAMHVLRVGLGGLEEPAPPLRFTWVKSVLDTMIPTAYVRAGLEATERPARWVGSCGARGDGTIMVSLDYVSEELPGLLRAAQGPILQLDVFADRCQR